MERIILGRNLCSITCNLFEVKERLNLTIIREPTLDKIKKSVMKIQDQDKAWEELYGILKEDYPGDHKQLLALAMEICNQGASYDPG
jgi:hypothetical protein